VLKFEFLTEAFIIFIKNIKKVSSGEFSDQCFKPFSYPMFWSFLKAQKVLKFEFVIEAIFIFVKSIKKASRVCSFYRQINYMNCDKFPLYRPVL